MKLESLLPFYLYLTQFTLKMQAEDNYRPATVTQSKAGEAGIDLGAGRAEGSLGQTNHFVSSLVNPRSFCHFKR